MGTLSGVDGGQIFVIPHLKGMDTIMHAFGVLRGTVAQWVRDGAPIYLVGKKYQASYADLWDWVKARSAGKGKSRKRE